MKNLSITLLLTCFFLTSFSQDIINSASSYNQSLSIDSTTAKITFKEVVEIPDATKDMLYARARQWIASRYKSSKDVLQMEDKESGILIGKALKKDVGGMKLFYTFKIYVKDKKYKIEITDLIYENYSIEITSNYYSSVRTIFLEQGTDPAFFKNDGTPRESYQKLVDATIISVNSLMGDFKAEMKNNIADVKSDW